MPFGVTSNFRYSGEDTMVVKRGEGAYIWDMDDNRYIDYRLAFGPIILGHADPRVNKRVIEAIAGSTIYAHTHMLEVEVAERIIEMCPGVDRVRFANPLPMAKGFARFATARDWRSGSSSSEGACRDR